jgi:hypothetical protein
METTVVVSIGALVIGGAAWLAPRQPRKRGSSVIVDGAWAFHPTDPSEPPVVRFEVRCVDGDGAPIAGVGLMELHDRDRATFWRRGRVELVPGDGRDVQVHVELDRLIEARLNPFEELVPFVVVADGPRIPGGVIHGLSRPRGSHAASFAAVDARWRELHGEPCPSGFIVASVDGLARAYRDTSRALNVGARSRRRVRGVQMPWDERLQLPLPRWWRPNRRR